MQSLFVILMLLTPTMILADDHHFTSSRPVQTITRFVRLEPSQPLTIDPIAIIAKAQALEMALQAIPDRALQRPQWRIHRFTNRMGAYKPSPLLKQVQVQVTRSRVIGVVNTSFRILPNGTVDFNVTKEQQQTAAQRQYYFTP